MKIVPAPLNYSVDECVSLLTKLFPYFDTFQIDVQDGKYITNKTIALSQYFDAFARIPQDNLKTKVFDFHLQTLSHNDEIRFLSRQKTGLKIGNILIHYSLKPDLEKLKNLYPYFSIGLVLNPEDTIEDFTSNYDLTRQRVIQIMTIHPGPQGSPFIPETLHKIDQLREKNYSREILIDGGVNQKTLPTILSRKNKPDVLCIGSFLTKTDKIPDKVEYLQQKTG